MVLGKGKLRRYVGFGTVVLAEVYRRTADFGAERPPSEVVREWFEAARGTKWTR